MSSSLHSVTLLGAYVDPGAGPVLYMCALRNNFSTYVTSIHDNGHQLISDLYHCRSQTGTGTGTADLQNVLVIAFAIAVKKNISP